MRIGIDLGNVLIGGDNEWFSDDYLDTPPVIGAWGSVNRLVSLGHDVFIVSKAYPRNQIKSLRWLRYWDLDGFFGWAGTFFVLRREDKTIVCDNLFLDLHIDDRSDIIDHINNNSKATKGYLFTTWDQFWEDFDDYR